MTLLVGTAVVAAGLVLLAVLTALGSRRRGASVLAFPATWTLWHLRDDHPYHRALPHHADRR